MMGLALGFILKHPPSLTLPHSGGREALWPRAAILLNKRFPPPAWGRVRVGGQW